MPQGLLAGVGTAFGNRLAGCYGVRTVVLLGVAALAAGTAAILPIGRDTPAWIIAAILSSRELALGLTIQPLLRAMIFSLEPEEVSDGSTLFNVAQRLGGSVGIALVFSFFQARERLYIDDVLREMGVGTAGFGTGTGRGGLGLASLPASVRDRLAGAAKLRCSNHSGGTYGRTLTY